MARHHEIAEASIVLANELPSRQAKTTHTDVLVGIAKRLQRLQTRAKKLRKDLKETERDIRATKRELKDLAAMMSRAEA